ncbi:hypothetical protein ABZT45_29440 [Streptomyces sp. NPDC005356]|uniref:hypothetical protein n=1 Tax=Streptomyces sp. NPDC005356 TaxID=3157167 RepID=UPI0033B87B58
MAYDVALSGHEVSHSLDPGVRMKLDFQPCRAFGANGAISTDISLAALPAVSS